MAVKRFSSGSDFENAVAYSRAVDDGIYVHVSGTTGFDYSTMTISADLLEQAQQCFVNLDEALEKAGTAMNRVVRIRYYYPVVEDFEPCWPIIRQYLDEVRPAATLVVADLIDARMRLEIEVTARSGLG